MTYFIGWDIGGAHVKVALIHHKKIQLVMQEPCPLWQGLDRLENVLKKLLAQLPCDKKHHHAVTMTGELVDLFANRSEGVEQIIKTVAGLLNDNVEIFCGRFGLLPIFKINQHHYEAIASANWLTSATLAAKNLQNCLFVDVGSTTTDILRCENGEVLAQGFSDYQRLISQELVYTGIVRTPVMAVVQTILDNEKKVKVGVMAEYFATMADVYRVTGELLEHCDQNSTADGGEKTIEASARRLARMVGDDFRIEELTRWQAVAKNIRSQQLKRIQSNCKLRLQNKKLQLVGAGIGRFLIQEIAEHLNVPYVDFSTLFETHGNLEFEPADCAPAVAVAYLSGSAL